MASHCFLLSIAVLALGWASALPTTTYCYHREDPNDHKCYEGCAMSDFKATGLTHPGECNPAVFTVTETSKTVDQCNDGKTNLKYCTGGHLQAVNITMKIKGEGKDASLAFKPPPEPASCKTDSDCPCSYCMNDKTKTAPYQCHPQTPGVCCTTDSDCPGSYCVNYAGKTPPFHCHGTFAINAPSDKAPGVTCGNSKNVVAHVLVRSHAIAAAKVDWCVSNSSSTGEADECMSCVDSLPAQPGNLTIAITDDVDYFVFAFKGSESGEQELYPDFVSGDWPKSYDLQDPSVVTQVH